MLNAVFSLVVVGLLLAAWRRPGVAVGLVISGYALEQCAQVFVPWAGYNNSLCNYLTALAAGLGALRLLLRHGTRILSLPGPVSLLLGLLAYCYATVLWSLFPATTSAVLNQALPYVVAYVAITPLLIRSERELEDAYKTTVLATSSALTLLVLFGDWVNRSVYLPFSNVYSNPLALSQSAGSVMIIAVLTPTVKSLGKRLWLPLALWVGFVVLVTFLKSASRGQIVSGIAVTLLFSMVTRGRKWFPLVLLAAAAAIGAGFMREEVEAKANRWDERQLQSDISEARVGKAQELLEFWTNSSFEHVIFGLGSSTAQDPRLLNGYPHVVPAEVLAEEGLAGFSLYLAAIGTAFYSLYQRGKRAFGIERNQLMALGALTLFEVLLTFKQGTLLGSPIQLCLLGVLGHLKHDASATQGPELSSMSSHHGRRAAHSR